MSKSPRDKRIFFDLNHPADFHFFKNLFHWLQQHGYSIRIMARKKECLQDLLKYHKFSFINRGAGSHSLVGKYLYGIYILAILVIHLLRFRPGVTISLSSPYLVVASKLLGIKGITYDDTDYNPRLLPILKRSDVILTPATYPYAFHNTHIRIQSFKELAYLHPAYFTHEKKGNGVFFRLTRTDSVHHISKSNFNTSLIADKINSISRHHLTYFSSETGMIENISQEVRNADKFNIHDNLKNCRVFWGNSATMAAEAAILGIPAVFVGTEKYSYIEELEAYGLLCHYFPDQVEISFNKLEELIEESGADDQFEYYRQKLLKDKIDITGFMIWLIENFPDSIRTMKDNPETQFRFRSGI